MDRRTTLQEAVFNFRVSSTLTSFYNKSSSVAETGDRLATIDMGRKVKAAVSPFLAGEARVRI